MPLTDRAKAELERRGPGNVRILLASAYVGYGQESAVKLRLGGSDPFRSDVEEWLAEKERDLRFVFWVRVAGILAILAAVVGIVGMVVPLLDHG